MPTLLRCHRPRALPIHFRAVAPETQVVIAIGADFAAVSEPRGMLVASEAHVPRGAANSADSGWGHLTSLCGAHRNQVL